MSCKHLMWGHYSKHRQEFCKDAFEDKEYLCPLAENDYVSMLEMFINKLYTDENFGLLGLNAAQAEEHVCKDMEFLGYNTEMVNRAFVYTVNNFKSKYTSVVLRLDSFVRCMLMQPHKEYVKESKDNNFAAGMRMVEARFEAVAKENIPPKELTIEDIEKLLGYKIKIVGEDK